VDVNALIGELQKMLGRLIGEDVALGTILDPALVTVRVDPAQLELALINLAVNARDAMPQGGKLTLATQNVVLDAAYVEGHLDATPGPHAMIAVTDTGHGMKPEVLARIFEPFFSTKKLGKGTGLGLATVYGIVRQSGGHMTVESEHQKGSTFRIYLPAAGEGNGSGEGAGAREARRPAEDAGSAPAGAATPAAAPAGAAAAPVRTGPETILLVEDDSAVRAVTRRALESSGYRVLEAGGGQEALAACESQPGPIDLLVTDVVMPEMAGRLLAEEMRRRRPGIRVLFISGYTDDAILRHGVQQAEVAFLQKPYTPVALASKVREALERPA
jgi:CheY-like chemotaxis protein